MKTEEEVYKRIRDVKMAIQAWSGTPGTNGVIRNLKGQLYSLYWVLGEMGNNSEKVNSEPFPTLAEMARKYPKGR